VATRRGLPTPPASPHSRWTRRGQTSATTDDTSDGPRPWTWREPVAFDGAWPGWASLLAADRAAGQRRGLGTGFPGGRPRGHRLRPFAPLRPPVPDARQAQWRVSADGVRSAFVSAYRVGIDWLRSRYCQMVARRPDKWFLRTKTQHRQYLVRLPLFPHAGFWLAVSWYRGFFSVQLDTLLALTK